MSENLSTKSTAARAPRDATAARVQRHPRDKGDVTGDERKHARERKLANPAPNAIATPTLDVTEKTGDEDEREGGGDMT